MKRIYCAGPLFNPKEREDMEAIADALQEAGYAVFLPHRDGIEMARVNSALVRNGYSLAEANSILARAIFKIDTYQVASNDGLVLNLNGRVPDEGAMVEAGIAWALGKPVVIHKDDSRSLIDGLDNPLVAGLSKFRIISKIGQIPTEFDRIFSDGYGNVAAHYDRALKEIIDTGKEIYSAYLKWKDPSTRSDGFLDLLAI